LANKQQIMAEDMDIEDELDMLDCSDPNVLNKYVLAGKIAQEVLQAVQAQAAVTQDVLELCEFGDNLIIEKTANLYKRGDISRGVAFPTCLSRNELAGHFCPIDLEGPRAVLEEGDLVKVDLGVQIDGFAALVATSFQVGEGPVTGRKADAVAAAWFGAQCALRMMRPGTTNEAITEMFTSVAQEFNCNCLEGVLSHELKQFVIDGEKTILAKPAPERQVDPFELEPNKVYAIDVVMSTGEGKAIRKDEHPTTIYKRMVEKQYQLRNKTSRAFLREINNNFPCYPFTLRSFRENLTRSRAGLRECLNHELVADYPVLHEREGEFIAQFKFTVVVRPNQGPLRLCGTPAIDGLQLQSECSIEKQELVTLLNTPWESSKKRKRKKKKKKAAAQPAQDVEMS